MEYRKLGRTGLEVSAVSLGTEYLHGQSRETVASVIHEAIERGVNYFDIVFSFAEYRDNLGAAFADYRDRVTLAGHICCGEKDGHYRMTRDLGENEELFHDLLSRLGTDCVDVLFVQMVNSMEDYHEVMQPGGIMDLARRFQREGKARFLAMSGHRNQAALEAIRSGQIGAWMFPVSLAWDWAPGRKEVFRACATEDVGLVAMKPYAGGNLFQREERARVSAMQCLHYVLSQPGMTCAVPGVKDLRELNAALAYDGATDEEKDFWPVLADVQQDLAGNCVYCNHCLPCEVGIDIGATMRKLDRALRPTAAKSGEDRESLYYPSRIQEPVEESTRRDAKPSDCIECGDCMERCPFDVDIISGMQMAAELPERT